MGLGASEESYRDALRKILPRGSIWVAPPGSILEGLLSAIASVCYSVHLRAVGVLHALDPRETGEALTDWERVLGFPTECAPLGETIQQRRDAVVQKITSQGGQSPQHFLDIAAKLGHAGATIEEYDYFRAGDPAGSPLIGEAWKHAFTVRTLEDFAITVFRAGVSRAGEPLRSWGNAQLECAIEAEKPAHTTALFAYGSA